MSDALKKLRDGLYALYSREDVADANGLHAILDDLEAEVERLEKANNKHFVHFTETEHLRDRCRTLQRENDGLADRADHWQAKYNKLERDYEGLREALKEARITVSACAHGQPVCHWPMGKAAMKTLPVIEEALYKPAPAGDAGEKTFAKARAIVQEWEDSQRKTGNQGYAGLCHELGRALDRVSSAPDTASAVVAAAVEETSAEHAYGSISSAFSTKATERLDRAQADRRTAVRNHTEDGGR